MLKRLVVPGLALVFTLGGCRDEPLTPAVDEEEALALPPGVHAYLTVSDRDAPAGATVLVTVNVQVVDVPLTIAGYHLTLRYDGEKLEPLAAQRTSFEGAQVVNLHAAEGVRAAGAAPEGIRERIAVLAAVSFRVKGQNYAQGLSLTLDDVTALEEFKQISAGIALLARPVLSGRYLEPEPRPPR